MSATDQEVAELARKWARLRRELREWTLSPGAFDLKAEEARRAREALFDACEGPLSYAGSSPRKT